MRPSLPATLLVLVLATAFVSLGVWQWQRGNARAAQVEQFARGAERALPLGSRTLTELPRFQRILVSGRYEPTRQFLLDNRTHEGQAGYEVLTPFVLADARTLLVDRGWVPFSGFREKLPEVSFTADDASVVGRIDELPSAGLASGRAPPAAAGSWPRVTSYPDMNELAAALGVKLEPRIVLLDRQAPHGYVRDWQPPGLTPIRHWSYAVQWWSFAVAVITIWLVLSVRRARGLHR